VTGRPSRIILVTGELALNQRGAEMLLAALDKTLQGTPPRYRGRSSYSELDWLYEQARIVASGSVSGTPLAVFRAEVPASGSHYITTAEAAGILGITERAVTKRIAAGQLRAERHGRPWWLDERAVREAAGKRRAA